MSYYGEVVQVVFLSLVVSVTATLIASLAGMTLAIPIALKDFRMKKHIIRLYETFILFKFVNNARSDSLLAMEAFKKFWSLYLDFCASLNELSIPLPKNKVIFVSTQESSARAFDCKNENKTSNIENKLNNFMTIFEP